MSRFGMGYGKDQAKHILSTRPAVLVHSARRQSVVNKWFQSDKEPRPDWFQTQFKNERGPTESDGEWQLVWKPRSRMGTATVPARRILCTLKDEDEKERLKERLAHELTKPSRGSADKDAKDDLISEVGSRSSRSRKLTMSARSGETTSQGRVTSRTAAEDGDVESEAQKTARSRRSKASRRSRSSMSTTSTLTQNQDELITRIKGLEEALLAEKDLREKMQSMLTMESWAKDDA